MAPSPVSQSDSWATQQLVEFVAAGSTYPDADSAILGAAETAAAALEAEVAAVVLDNRVAAAIGFPRGGVPERELVDVAARRNATLVVEGLGACQATSVPLGPEEPGWLLVARHGDEALDSADSDLLRGMGRVLAMALRTMRLLDSLRERQALLERLSRLQRSIARQADLQEVLDAIVAGAEDLLGDEVVVLSLLRADDAQGTEVVSSAGIEEGLRERLRCPILRPHGSAAVARDGDLLVMEDGVHPAPALSQLAAAGLRSAMAAPVHVRGALAGSVVVATRRDRRLYSDSEREMLMAFAEHAGLALNDARAMADTFHQAFHDSLTGLPNRALFLDRLGHALERSRRSGAQVAVLFADLDGFKNVNDSLGHEAGDELLAMVAERLRGGLRPADTAARFGGDEFAILLDDADRATTAKLVAERILESLQAPFRLRERELHMTASIGIARGWREPDRLMRDADLAMYQAKSRGRGRWEEFEPGMHAAAVKRLELENDLEGALRRDELVVHYQPLCRLDTGEVTGLEALMRWRHPSRGLLEAAEFIEVAEESRQMVALGRWVLADACRQAALWQARYPRAEPLEMSVNLSALQLDRPGIVDDVHAALAGSGLPARCLVLELTQTALMADTSATEAKLSALQRLGVQLAVDNFGTGHSSLEYLRRFPLDVLKVAKSFVNSLDASAGAGLMRAILDLAASVGMRVVAEGVETAAQRDTLVELGCSHGQGFLFARPAPAAATDLLLLQARVIGAGHVAARPDDAEAAAG